MNHSSGNVGIYDIKEYTVFIYITVFNNVFLVYITSSVKYIYEYEIFSIYYSYSIV